MRFIPVLSIHAGSRALFLNTKSGCFCTENDRFCSETDVFCRLLRMGATLISLQFASSAGSGGTAWLAIPPGVDAEQPTAGVLVLVLPGLGGTAEEAVKGSDGIYTYGLQMLARGWVVLAVDIESHSLRHRLYM